MRRLGSHLVATMSFSKDVRGLRQDKLGGDAFIILRKQSARGGVVYLRDEPLYGDARVDDYAH